MIFPAVDPKKGERLILVTDNQGAEVADLIAYAQSVGAPELAAPRSIVKVAGSPGSWVPERPTMSPSRFLAEAEASERASRRSRGRSHGKSERGKSACAQPAESWRRCCS